MFKAVIDKASCTGCGACVSQCPVRAISLSTDTKNRKTADVNKQICTGCGACIPACRFQAITLF
ncbi:MAG: 4Fe-4S binding protein [Deferribacterales bacterium]